MANFNYPSFFGGPLFGDSPFAASMFENIYYMDVSPNYLTSKSDTNHSQLRSYNGHPYNSYARSRAKYTQLPSVGSIGYSVPTGLWMQNDGIYTFDDYIFVDVILTNYAPDRKFQYRITVYSLRLGSSYDTGYINTIHDALTIDTQIWMGPNKGGYCDVNWQVDIIELGVSASGSLANYGYPSGMDSQPDEWRMIQLGGANELFSTQISRLIYQTVSRITTPTGIVSSQAFGSPTVALVSASKSITSIGIPSAEGFGFPSLAGSVVDIEANSILSVEAFGNPAIVITTTVVSSLPSPSPAKEGDIRITFDQYDQFVDFILADRDVDRDDGLETAILITLLTDKRADAGDPLPDDSGYRGGWFGDALPVVSDYKMGTKLWLLQRSKTIAEIPAIAKEYLADGFKWMIEDGIVKSVDVIVERRRDLETTLAFTLSFTKPEGTTIFYRFFYNWEAQLLRRQ